MKRFYDKVIMHPSGCWEWTGNIGSGGYGNFRLNGKIEKSHRVSYALNWKLDSIPEGMKVCHTCDNPSSAYTPTKS